MTSADCKAELAATGHAGSRSVLRPARIDVLVPEQDPPGHALDVFEARLAQGLGELHRAAAALAVDDDLLTLVLTELVDVLRQLLEREQLSAGDVRDLVFVGQPAIDKVELFALIEHRLDLARRDLPVGPERVARRQAARVEV